MVHPEIQDGGMYNLRIEFVVIYLLIALSFEGKYDIKVCINDYKGVYTLEEGESVIINIILSVKTVFK